MAKKNVLQEIKGFKTVPKTKQPTKIKPDLRPAPVVSEPWEAWQCRGDSGNPANWHQTWEGSFEDCFACVEENVSCQIDEILNRDGSLDALLYKYEDEDEKLTQILEGLYTPRIKQIQKECLQNGAYKGDTWALGKPSQANKFRPRRTRGGIFTHSNSWAGFEQVGKKANDPDSWRCIADGSLDECVEAMAFFVTNEIERATAGQLSDETEVGGFLRYKIKLRLQLIDEIQRICSIKGEYKGWGWIIRSLKSEEDCWSQVINKTQ
jgi:hypothetical protein